MAIRAQEHGGEARTHALQRALTISIVILVSLGLVWYGLTLAWNWVTSLDQFRVYPGRLALQPAPWLNIDALKADMLRTDRSGLLATGCSIFTPRLAQRVAGAYGASPWVRRVVAVERKFPDQLLISLEIRQPFAIVVCGKGRYLVDRDGMILAPELYRLPKDGLGRPDIVLSCAPESAPQRGRTWNSEPVLAGIDMLAFLGDKAALNGLKVQGLEVQRDTSVIGRAPVCVVLKTDSGAQVRWGLPPRAPLAGTSEVSTAAKLEALTCVVRQHGSQLSRLEYIDIRWDRPTLALRKP